MRINGVPYAIAILSHFLVGDIITGNPTLFYGFSNQTFGNFSTTLSSEYGQDYGILFRTGVEAVMVILFAVNAVTKRNVPPLFSFPLKHVLILGLVALTIFIGTIKNQILFLALNPNEIVYFTYCVSVLSQLIFMVIIVKGTSRVFLTQLAGTKG